MRSNEYDVGLTENMIRFFSFFTILTNLLVTVYFTYLSVKPKLKPIALFEHRFSLTAITTYITLVGLIFTISLRSLWKLEGLALIMSEVHHTVVPLMVIIFWLMSLKQLNLKWSYLPLVLIYPSIYLVIVLIRGQFSGFYPYPFLDITTLGMQSVLLNCIVLMFVLLVLASIYIGIWLLIKPKKKLDYK